MTTIRATRAAIAAATIACSLLAGCRATGQNSANGDAKQPSRSQVIPTESVPGPNSCQFRHRDGQPLPDPRCTPGATNPAVT